jgi:NAD(P)-dependent dehydrogenase (short-subunit alcohol dehydrogenase family)
VSQSARFAGKTALVTGGGSGIGQAVVVRLASEGAAVIAFDTNEKGLLASAQQAAAAAAAHGGKVRHVTGSVANEGSVRELLAEVAQREGRLDALINMAGILRTQHSTEVTLDQFRAVLEVNLIGTFLCCREALPMLEAAGGSIVNAASTAALFGHPYMAAYAASKGGVYALTRALAWEYIKRGVRVNAVAPGGIRTPMVTGPRESLASLDASLFAHLQRPDRGFGSPEQVAAVIAMLASADGGYMNGEIVKIDGGVHS